jgi:hypothetical protein
VTEVSLRIRALLSAQRALIGMIPPDLRGAAVSWTEGHVRGRFMFDALTADAAELVREIETEVMADFEDDVEVRFDAVDAAAPRAMWLADGEEWVFLRQAPELRSSS